MKEGKGFVEEVPLRKRGSQMVLRALREANGAWVPSNTLYRMGVVAHSRVSDLRAQGHSIECKRFGLGDYRYRLAA